VIDRPLFRKAISCSRRERVSNLYSVVSKIFGSAQKVTVVPVFFVWAPFVSGPAGRLATYGWDQM
jgi:hypothetical protein